MAVLSNIRQRSALMIAVIAFALFAFIIGDLFSSGGFSTSKDVGSINGKDISFEDFRIKVSNVEKVLKELLQLLRQIECGTKEVSVALLTSEFDKLGLRVGEKHLLAVLKADQILVKSNVLAAGMFDLANLKNTSRLTLRKHNTLKDRVDAELSAKYQIYNTMIQIWGLYYRVKES
jgi:peptidyl-prolyl cis-trans isomerase D